LALTDPSATSFSSTISSLSEPTSTLSARPRGDTPVRHTTAAAAVDWIASTTTSGAPVHSMTMSGSEAAHAPRTVPLV